MSAPEVDLEQQKVSSVNWGQVASGNFFTDNDLEPKDLEQTEAIGYVKNVLKVVLLQMAGMSAAGILCVYFKLFKGLVGNPIVMWLALGCTLAFFILMHYKPDLRKDAPLNHTYLLAGSISMIVLYGSVCGRMKSTIAVTFMIAQTCAIAGLWGGAIIAKSSTNREYLIRKLMTGALAGFFVCTAILVVAMSMFKFKGKETTFIVTMLLFLIVTTYFGYVLVFVVLPGHASNKEDYIWGVVRIYIHIIVVIITLISMCFKKSDDEQ